MLLDITEVKPLNDYYLFIRFEDGRSGEIDLSKIIEFKGIFEKLKDKEYFRTVRVHPELGTIYWQNGADLAPCSLYNHIN